MTAERFRIIISAILLLGVSTSAFLMTSGLLGSFVVGWQGSLLGAGSGVDRTTDFGAFAGDLAALRPIGLARTGLAVLVATPVVRVGTSVLVFVLEGDRLYAAITLVVLVILLLSLLVIH